MHRKTTLSSRVKYDETLAGLPLQIMYSITRKLYPLNKLDGHLLAPGHFFLHIAHVIESCSLSERTALSSFDGSRHLNQNAVVKILEQPKPWHSAAKPRHNLESLELPICGMVVNYFGYCGTTLIQMERPFWMDFPQRVCVSQCSVAH